MKHYLTAALLAASFTASAQQLPPAPPPPDLHLSGEYLERAGSQRNKALLVALGGIAMGSMILATDEENTTPAAAAMGIGGVIALGMNISSNGKIKKAGRIMQGK